MGRYTTGGVGRDILAGAAAGIAAIWIADKLDQAIYRAGGPEAIRKTEAARPGGMDPAHVLAKRAADALGTELGNPKDNAAGHTIHYGIAASMGALYGLTRGMAPSVSTGRGALFGIAMFVLQDQIGNTVMGTAGNPMNYPIRDHARGAAAHTLFGIVTDLCTRLMSPWRDEVVIEHGPPLSERWDRGREYLGQQRDTLYEQGRQYAGQGRGLLDQGIDYATQLAGQLATQARARIPQVDAAEAARQGRRYANQAADTVRSRLPDTDPAEMARAARRQASGYGDEARAYVAQVPSGLSRARKWLFG